MSLYSRSPSSFSFQRQRMVEEQLVPRGISDPAVLKAMTEVPRHRFVKESLQSKAYSDYPLPTEFGQTISQPYIVALMSQTLHLTESERVLEIGTGSGYQAAILSRLCAQVYTVERIHSLLSRAQMLFDCLQYRNIISRPDDGSTGWVEKAPFDAIMVTAAVPEIPAPLSEQLADPGRMIIPVGSQEIQELQILEKKNGEISVHSIEHVRFVNLIGTYGWKN